MARVASVRWLGGQRVAPVTWRGPASPLLSSQR